MAKKENTIWWIFGVILFVIIAYNAGFHFPFAIVTTQTCISNTISDWEFNGNVLDEKGVNNGVNFGGTFSLGTINFNGSTYMNLPAVSGDVIEIIKYPIDTNFVFLARINSLNYVNGIQDNTRPIIPLGENMGLGTNVTIDKIAVFSNLTLQDMQNLYNNGNFGDICWTTSQEVNVTCESYALSQIPNNLTGSLSMNNGIYPNCTFVWKSPQYKITNNVCSKSFLYTDSCLISGGCYLTNQSCTENLAYSCYVLSNNVCSVKTDYTSCKVNTTSTYLTSSDCNSHVQNVTSPVTTPPPVSTGTIIPPEEGFTLQNLTTKELFNLFGFSVTLLHLIIALIAVIAILYFIGVLGKKQ